MGPDSPVCIPVCRCRSSKKEWWGEGRGERSFFRIEKYFVRHREQGEAGTERMGGLSDIHYKWLNGFSELVHVVKVLTGLTFIHIQ